MTQYPTFTDVQAAAARIKPYAHRTPVLTCTSLNDLVGADLFCKCENFQKVGAFKFRGACNTVFGTVHNRPKVVDSWFGETARIAGSGHKESARDWPLNEAQLPAKTWRFRQLERPLVAGGALKRRSLRSLGVQESLMASCPHAGGA